MSSIFGLFHLDGRPVDPGVPHTMCRALAHRGADASEVWVQGPVALGCRQLRTTPEALHERQPLRDESGNLCLVLDGRIDNRDELRQGLAAHHAVLRDESDAELVLRAYQVWGEDCGKHLIGDYAFAIWDQSRWGVFACRDAMGVRPFYFSHRPGSAFAFGSDPAALFAIPGFPKKPRLDALADYLLNNFKDSGTTEFEAVSRLRPAHSIWVGRDALSLRQYWDVDANGILKLRGAGEYAEALSECLGRVIRSQSRCSSRPGVAFSGGFDSSTILCLLENQHKAGGGPAPVAYSCIFNGTPYDEGHYMRSVQERWGTEIHWCQPQPPQPLWGLPECLRADAQPMNVPLAYPMKELFNQAERKGTRVILGGLGGDDLMDAPMALGADLLVRGRFRDAWSYAAAQSRFHSIPMIRPIEYCLVRPLLSLVTPGWMKREARRWRPRPRNAAWLREPFARQAVARFRSEPWYLRGKRFSRPVRQATYNIIHSGYRVQALEWWDRLAASSSIEVRHPFYDRRLVELVATMPDDEMVRGYEPKGLMRHVMKRHFPELLNRRRDKADFTTLMNQRLIHDDAEQARSILSDMELAKLRVVDQARARECYEGYRIRYASRLNDNRGIDTVWELLSLEGWARKAFAAGS